MSYKTAELAKLSWNPTENAANLKEISNRINEAVKQYDDVRLKIAIDLAEAKKICDWVVATSFKTWVKQNIKFSYTEAVRLAKVGEAKNPKAALAKLRMKTKQSVKKHSAKVALASATANPLKATVTPLNAPAAMTKSALDIKASRSCYVAHLKKQDKFARAVEICALLKDIGLSRTELAKIADAH